VLAELERRPGGRLASTDREAYERMLARYGGELDRLEAYALVERWEGEIRMTRLGRYWSEWNRRREAGGGA
jgi:hypothetical protein